MLVYENTIVVCTVYVRGGQGFWSVHAYCLLPFLLQAPVCVMDFCVYSPYFCRSLYPKALNGVGGTPSLEFHKKGAQGLRIVYASAWRREVICGSKDKVPCHATYGGDASTVW